MSGGNVLQYFLRDQVTGDYFCSFCNKKYAKSTTSTRLRCHLTGEAKNGARSCLNVPPHVKESLSIERSNKRQKAKASGCIASSSSSQQRKRPFEELQLPSQHQLEPPILGDHIADEEWIAELMQLDLGEQINKYAPLMENISNFPPGERDDEFDDCFRELQSCANNHSIPSFSPELNNDCGNQGGVLQYMMSTHPNESGSVENLPLPNGTIGRTTQLQHQFSTEDLIQTPLEGQTNEASLMMEETPNFPLGGRATMASNESGSNLQPKALSSAADFMSQDLRNCRLTDQADQHEVRDEVTVQQEVQMVEGNQEAGESATIDEAKRYDVFLSFRGADVRDNFISHLHQKLCDSGIETFIDNDLNRGDDIYPSLLTAIENSYIYLITFSENYADSISCLKELAKIFQCRNREHKVLPVFYGVDPSDIEKQTGKFGLAFDKLQKSLLRDGEVDLDLDDVRSHLKVAAGIGGWDSRNIRPDTELIKSIVGDILKKLNRSTNKRQRTMPDVLPIVAEIESLKETRGVAFLTKKLVGQMFKRNQDKVWSLLKKDEVSSIGIYGMGGVGKTELMTHVHNRLLKGTSASGNVSWVTVSQDFSIPKLQNLIAKTINLDLSHEEDEKKRAAKLCDVLNKKKSVVILDDLWKNFIPEDVGIPVRVDACKLIVTSRSVEVCRGVGCQEMMKIDPLSEEEAWTLFVEKLGCHVRVTPELEPVARSVAKECDGLPLGIITLAASMRGVDDVHEWRYVLTELKESKVGKDDMELKVFKILKYSYLRLNDPGLQQSFLYCALYPEDCRISRKDLINFIISEGIIERMRSRQAECDKGHAILNKLENVCLLEDASSSFSHNGDDRCLKMHDLIRDMALQIMAESPRSMVEADAQLTELPDEEKWTCDLVRVSLMKNNIQKILSIRTSCPVLSTLLLRENSALKVIEDSFFRQFQGLKVLDLSNTAIQNLPSSISDLVNLTALLLIKCKQLSHLPSLAKLRALRMLNVRQTGLKEVPQGMKLLSNLRYLNINNVRLKVFPTDILPHLLCLQSLNLSQIFIAKPEELAFLKMLETLECCFKNLLDFKTHLKSCEEKQPLIGYKYTIGGLPCSSPRDVNDSSKEVLVVNFNISRDLVLPKCIEDLKFRRCHDIRSLCSVFLLKNAPKPKRLEVMDCKEMECLLESSCSPNILESINTLHLSILRNLSFLIGAGVAPEPLAFSSTFSCLKKFDMLYCHSITKLFPHSFLKNLQNLEEIKIDDCKKMEEIIVIGEGDAVQDINTELRLPKLKRLILRSLPELKSICSETLICDSLEEIRFVNCINLKKIPLSLPLPTVEKTQAYPRDWWESLEWSDPNAFNILSRFCVFHNKSQAGVTKRKKAGKSIEYRNGRKQANP